MRHPLLVFLLSLLISRLKPMNRIPVPADTITPPYSDTDRIAILCAVYNDFHNQIRTDEARENKITVALVTAAIGLAAFSLKDGWHCRIPPVELYYFIAGLLAAAVLTGWFLWENSKRISWQCRQIVTIETLLGFYEENAFQKAGINAPKTVLDKEGSNWGHKWKRNRLLRNPHLMGVVAAACIAIFPLYISCDARRESIKATQGLIHDSVLLLSPRVQDGCGISVG